MSDVSKNALTFFGLFVSAFVPVVALIGIACMIKAYNVDDSMALPILAITGIIVVIATLSVVSLAFGLYDMSDVTQALALPEGSIRSVIAISLIVLFGIFTVYLYSSMIELGGVVAIKGVAESDVADMKVKFGDLFLGEVKEAAPPGATGTTHTVYYKNMASQAGNDFAKQVLTLMGTLVTAITSFYFGTATVSAARRRDGTDDPGDVKEDKKTPPEGTPGPKLTSIDKTTLTRGPDAQQLTLIGSALADVDTVTLKQADKQIAAKIASKALDSLKVEVIIAATQPIGKWDVVVAAKDKTHTLAAALTVT